MDNIVERYGIPTVLTSDEGGEFTSRAFENWLQEFGIRHHLTSPYHPQSNGIIERFNGTIQKLLLKLTGGNERKWSTFLAETLYAYWITAGLTGISPYKAVYGQRARLPRAATSPTKEGERHPAIREAEKILMEYQDQKRDTYKKAEPNRAKRLSLGTLVAPRVL